MTRKFISISLAAVLAGSVFAPAAEAQTREYYYSHGHRYERCVRHSANNGTATGAVVGGATVGLLSHSVAGGLIGAGVGAVAGHQIAKHDAKRSC
jgi:outer membrane lipoprotein SlyB